MMNMKRHIRNEKGVALMMVLLIATVGLSVTATMLYMIIVSTQSSGMHKRFATALEAGVGGEAVIKSFISTGGTLDSDPKYVKFADAISLDVPLTSSCIADKLNLATESWNNACDKGRVIDVKDNATYDLVFTLGSFEIYTKIIHTTAGNTATGVSAGGKSSSLVGGGVTHVVASGATGTGTGNIATAAVPYIYTIVAEARNKVIKSGLTEDDWRRAKDKARIYILYEY